MNFKNIVKKITNLTRMTAGGLTGFFTGLLSGPFATAGRSVIWFNAEYLIPSDDTKTEIAMRISPLFLVTDLIIIALALPVGLVYGPLRGAYLGVKEELNISLIKDILKELYTYNANDYTAWVIKTRIYNIKQKDNKVTLVEAVRRVEKEFQLSFKKQLAKGDFDHLRTQCDFELEKEYKKEHENQHALCSTMVTSQLIRGLRNRKEDPVHFPDEIGVLIAEYVEGATRKTNLVEPKEKQKMIYNHYSGGIEIDDSADNIKLKCKNNFFAFFNRFNLFKKEEPEKIEKITYIRRTKTANF